MTTKGRAAATCLGIGLTLGLAAAPPALACNNPVRVIPKCVTLGPPLETHNHTRVGNDCGFTVTIWWDMGESVPSSAPNALLDAGGHVRIEPGEAKEGILHDVPPEGWTGDVYCCADSTMCEEEIE